MVSAALKLRHGFMRQSKTRRMWMVIALAVVVLAAVSLLWHFAGLQDIIHVDAIVEYLRRFEASSWAPAWIIGLYALTAVTFFPAVLLSAAVVVVLSGIKGFLLCVTGSMVSSIAGYYLGRLAGRDWFERRFPAVRKIYRKVHAGGVLGVAIVRTIPMAPYAAINVIFGIIKVPVLIYLAGTLLGILPGKVMLAFFGTSLRDFLENPSLAKAGQGAVLMAVWLCVLFACHAWARQRKDAEDSRAGLGA